MFRCTNYREIIPNPFGGHKLLWENLINVKGLLQRKMYYTHSYPVAQNSFCGWERFHRFCNSVHALFKGPRGWVVWLRPFWSLVSWSPFLLLMWEGKRLGKWWGNWVRQGDMVRMPWAMCSVWAESHASTPCSVSFIERERNRPAWFFHRACPTDRAERFLGRIF
jgi:hypothetical protein